MAILGGVDDRRELDRFLNVGGCFATRVKDPVHELPFLIRGTVFALWFESIGTAVFERSCFAVMSTLHCPLRLHTTLR